MHIECIPANNRRILKGIQKVLRKHNFVLAGGTALSIQIGHRVSIDFDFFTKNPFSTDVLFRELKKAGLKPIVHQEEKGTLTVIIEGVKISMFHYPYPFIEDKLSWKGIDIAGIIDIASMKIMAISQRGAKRDFVDLYFILQDTPFRKIALNMIKRFGKERINPIHIGKSLVYFEDAEIDPDPRQCDKELPSWNDVKTFFIRNIKQITMDLQSALQV